MQQLLWDATDGQLDWIFHWSLWIATKASSVLESSQKRERGHCATELLATRLAEKTICFCNWLSPIRVKIWRICYIDPFVRGGTGKRYRRYLNTAYLVRPLKLITIWVCFHLRELFNPWLWLYLFVCNVKRYTTTYAVSKGICWKFCEGHDHCFNSNVSLFFSQ